MSFFLTRPNKALAALVLLGGFAVRAHATEDAADTDEQLYSYLFPEGPGASAGAPAVAAAPVVDSQPRPLSAFGSENRRKGWTAAQVDAMKGAFKPRPAPIQAAPEVAGVEPQGPGFQGPVTGELKESPYADLVNKYAAKRSLDPQLVHRVILAESNYDPEAVSPKGAKGLMQLMDSVSERFNIDPYDPESNINVGTQYLAELMAKYKSVDLALAAYNAGPGAVDKYMGVPPYPETQNYVSSIKAGMASASAAQVEARKL